MFSMDCAACPNGPGGCDGCIVSFLLGESSQVEDVSVESCGYVLPPEVRSAIEVLREVGMVTTVEIVASYDAA